MQLISAEFPPAIAFGADVRPGWLTTVITAISGAEFTNQNWSQVRHNYDLTMAVRTASDYEEVRAHFHQARGRARKFLFQDPLDYTVALAEGKALGGDMIGSPTVPYQLYKRYGSGSDYYDRKITRPVSGTLTIYRTRSGNTTNVTANCTVNHSTGTFIVTGHSSGDVYTWSGQFKVPCRYDMDELPATIQDKEPGPDGEYLIASGSIKVVEVRE